MDGSEYSRVVGVYVAFGEGLEGMTTLVITQHPNGSVTAAPADYPELIGLLIPETLENVRRLHELADAERRRKTA